MWIGFNSVKLIENIFSSRPIRQSFELLYEFKRDDSTLINYRAGLSSQNFYDAFNNVKYNHKNLQFYLGAHLNIYTSPKHQFKINMINHFVLFHYYNRLEILFENPTYGDYLFKHSRKGNILAYSPGFNIEWPHFLYTKHKIALELMGLFHLRKNEIPVFESNRRDFGYRHMRSHAVFKINYLFPLF